MKEQYIKQVEKELCLPRNEKKEVVRDLNEVFASALEHGETEQQVIERLGTPKEFAENTAEQLGIDIHKITSFNPARLRTYILVKQSYKIFIHIMLLVSCSYHLIGHAVLQIGICSDKDSSVHRDKMRCKNKLYIFAGCI